MSELLTKSILLLLGLVLGYTLCKQRERVKNAVSNTVFNWILPYVMFVEVSSMTLVPYWWGYSIIGALFALVPFFIGLYLLKLSSNKAALLATAEGGSMGFAIYATIGGAPLAHFFLVDMVGNGLAVFLIILPLLAFGARKINGTVIRLLVAVSGGLAANFIGFHPLKSIPVLNSVEPVLVMVLIFLIASVVGSSIVIKTSREIVTSKFFLGFWAYRLTLFTLSLAFGLPLAVTILAILPPSFMLPIFYRTQNDPEKEAYASNFIASCIPITVILATYLILSV